MLDMAGEEDKEGRGKEELKGDATCRTLRSCFDEDDNRRTNMNHWRSPEKKRVLVVPPLIDHRVCSGMQTDWMMATYCPTGLL